MSPRVIGKHRRFHCKNSFIRRGLILACGISISICCILNSVFQIVDPASHNTKPKSYEKYLLSVYPGSQECVPPEAEESVDLPKHTVSGELFKCHDDTEELQPLVEQRLQIYIECSDDDTTVSAREQSVGYFDDLQSFKTVKEKLCLQRYIQHNCYDGKPVPDVIHLLWYGSPWLGMRSMLGLYSILTVARPCLVVVHSDVTPSGDLWDVLRPVALNLVHVHKKPQLQINGRWIKAVQNQADIGRIEILLEYGGIYLDSDVVVLRKLDIFREAHFAAGKAGSSSNLANGILIAEPRNSVLMTWLSQWQTYDGVSWNSHSTHMLTKLAKKYPHKMTTLGPVFIKFGFLDTNLLYNASCSLGDSYTAHLYRRDFPSDEVTYIRSASTTYARIARFVMFGDPEACSPKKKKKLVHRSQGVNRGFISRLFGIFNKKW